MMFIRQFAALLVIVSANFILAQTPRQAELATVEGLVTDIANGRPVGGAQVQLAFPTETTDSPAVTTDSTGRYRFVDIFPGEYHLRVEARGYRVYETRRDPTRLPIQVRAGGAIRSDLQISRGAAIAGRVANAAGEPVVGAQVLVERDAYAFGHRYRERLRFGEAAVGNDLAVVAFGEAAVGSDLAVVAGNLSTDDEGRFRIDGLAEGDYYLAVLAPPASAIFYPATSDREGAVAVRVTREAEMRGQELGGINIQWRSVPTVPVRGRVVGVADPQRVSVALLGPRGRPVTHFRFVIVDSDGRFELDAPPHGEYELHATHYSSSLERQGNAQGASTRGAGITTIFVGEEGIDEVAIAIRPAGSLEGEFVWESTPPPEFPWDQITVMLVRTFVGTTETSGTPSDGRFTLTNASPVPLRLVIRELPRGTYVESAFHGGTNALSGEFNPADDPQAALRIRLGNQAGVVRGTAVEPDGDPVVGATMTLVPDADRRQRMDLFQTVASGDDGRFEFDTVAPGTYLVFGWDSIPPGAIQNESFRLPYEPRGSRIHVERLGVVDAEVGVIER